MQTNPTQAAIDLCIALGIPDHHALTIQSAFTEREEKAGFERRNIISHATMGNTTGEGMSVNDICVEISRQRNKLYQAGKDASAEREARLVGALEKLYRGYVNTLENGRDRITFLGGECDPVERMESGDPVLIEARATLAALKDRTHG